MIKNITLQCIGQPGLCRLSRIFYHQQCIFPQAIAGVLAATDRRRYSLTLLRSMNFFDCPYCGKYAATTYTVAFNLVVPKNCAHCNRKLKYNMPAWWLTGCLIIPMPFIIISICEGLYLGYSQSGQLFDLIIFILSVSLGLPLLYIWIFLIIPLIMGKLIRLRIFSKQ